MMSSQPLFIPLYFDEAEADLWLALQRVEPEKRSYFIKETLRQVLLGTNSEEFFRSPLNKVLDNKVSEEIPDDSPHPKASAQAEEILEDKVEQIDLFSLDDLFAHTDVPLPDDESVIRTDCEKVKSIPGFEYMMKHIIGTEEDEAVLMILKESGNRKPNSR